LPLQSVSFYVRHGVKKLLFDARHGDKKWQALHVISVGLLGKLDAILGIFFMFDWCLMLKSFFPDKSLT